MFTKEKLGPFLTPECRQNNSITGGTSKVRQPIRPLILPSKGVLSKGNVDIQSWTFNETVPAQEN